MALQVGSRGSSEHEGGSIPRVAPWSVMRTILRPENRLFISPSVRRRRHMKRWAINAVKPTAANSRLAPREISLPAFCAKIAPASRKKDGSLKKADRLHLIAWSEQLRRFVHLLAFHQRDEKGCHDGRRANAFQNVTGRVDREVIADPSHNARGQDDRDVSQDCNDFDGIVTDRPFSAPETAVPATQ